MTPAEWATVVGVVSASGGLLVGYGIAWGKQNSKTNQHGQVIEQLNAVIGKLSSSFADCQRRGAECASSTRVMVEANAKQLAAMQVDFAAHKASVHQHHEALSIHTTDEWRKGVMDRFDRIENGIDRKLEAQTDLLVSRLEQVEKLVRNGNGK